ncbi:hypothetical protein DXG01_007232, partial [Tephrocybe rancida]
ETEAREVVAAAAGGQGDRGGNGDGDGQQQQQQQDGPQPSPQADDSEHLERDQKAKLKLRVFDPNMQVSNVIVPHQSSYALNKLASYEYCKLWYFSQEGCEDALRTQHTEVDDAFGMSKMGELVTLRPITAVQALKRALQDEQLTWEQFSCTRQLFVQYVLKSDWPEEHVQSLLHFFLELESSHFINCKNGRKVALTYQVHVHPLSMDAMKGSEGVFNITLINNELMESICREIQSSTTADLQCQHGLYTLCYAMCCTLHTLHSMPDATPAFPIVTPQYNDDR